MHVGYGRQTGPVNQPRGPRSAGSTLHWLTLQFSSPALEKEFQLSWARSILSVDRWYLCFTLLFMPVWLGSEARRWSSSILQDRCPAAVIPYTGTGTDLCTLQQLVLYTACACMGARLAALLVLWRHPDWHVRNRTVVVAVNWLLDILLRIVLGAARCGVLETPCGSMLLIDVCLALMFIAYHLPFPVALPCCSLYWAGCTLLRNSVPPAVLLSEHGVQLLVQLLLPLGALRVLGRKARLAYWAFLCSSAGAGHARTADDAALASAPRPSTAESSRTAAAGQQPQLGQAVQVPDDGLGIIPADSLVYESPLLHRTVAIKVQDGAAGPDSRPMLTRLAASVQSAIAGLPGMDHAALGSRVCIPGCMLFLGNVTYAKQQHLSATPVQQHQQPLLQGRAWQIALGAGCSSIGTYQTVDSLESAAADGSLRLGIASLLDASRPAASCQEAYLISSWGAELQVAAHCFVSEESSWYCADTATSSGLLVRLVLANGSTVLFDREEVLLPRDSQVAVWTLQLQLPSMDGRGSSSSGSGASVGSTHDDGSGGSSSPARCSSPAENKVRQPLGFLSLYVLPAQSPLQQQQHRLSSTGSHGSNIGSEAKAQGLVYAPLAHISLLLLPVETASELLSWLHSCKLSRQQLQPLLVDLAVVLEACSMLHAEVETGSATAAPAGPSRVAGEDWSLAAGAAGRLLQLFDRDALLSCSEVVAAVQRQVQAVSHGKAAAAEGAAGAL